MGWEAWITAGVLGFVLGMMVFTRIGPDLIMLAGVTVLLVCGVLDAREALEGLASPGMVTVGVLFVVVAGMRQTGVIGWVAHHLLGRPGSLLRAQFRIVAPVSVLSAFLNNTPVVAMFIPAVTEWARKHGLPLSKLMLPISYAAIMGGTCTLIGTSTNLVVNGLLVSQTSLGGLAMFEPAWIGLPLALAGTAYLLVAGRWLLPDRVPPIHRQEDPREYTVEMLVQPDGPLVGRTVRQANLRHLPGLYLMEIVRRDVEEVGRRDRVLPAVGPEETLQGDDRLVFVGEVASVVELHKMPGLRPAGDHLFDLSHPRAHRCLIEAVVSPTCPLVGRTIREGHFRSTYDAAIVAVARDGRRIRGKIGDIALQPGDTLLLETHPSFVLRNADNRDFYLVSEVADSQVPRHDKMRLAVATVAGMVLAVSLGWLSMLQAALLASGVMILSRCLTGPQARRSVDWQVLLVIAAAFGIGRAMQVSGLAAAIAERGIALVRGNPWAALAMVYVVTTVFTEVITNNAAAILVFPIALRTASALDVNVMPFAVAVMIAASASFSTPLGYQTNLMVYGPGGYRFNDYLRVGVPLNLLAGALTLAIAPVVWPF